MKKIGMSIACMISAYVMGLEYDVQFEDEHTKVVIVKLQAHEEVGLHRDEYPKIVIALKGGVIRRFEADGSITDVEFPTGKAVFRDIDPPNELHRGANQENEEMELVMIELKKSSH